MGSISALNNTTEGTVSKAGQIDGVTLIPGALVKGFLVGLTEDGITGVSSVTEWTNDGTGGSSYDLDTVVGTGANLKPHPSGSMVLYGASGDYASTPDSAAVSVTGDIEIIISCAVDDWTPAAPDTLASKWNTVGSQRSYICYLNTNGTLQFLASPDGTAEVSAVSTAAVGFTDGERGYIKITFDVDNGASGNTTTFYTSNDGVSFSQLGDPVVNAGATSIFDGTAPLTVGIFSNGTSFPLDGSIYRAQIYNGIDGTLVADFNPLDLAAADDRTITSTSTGEVWTLNGNTYVQNTGHTVVHSIGSAGLESTAGQDIAAPYTAFVVARFSQATPAADGYLTDARSVGTKRLIMYSDDSNADKFTMFSGGNLALSEAYDTDPHVFTAQYNADTTSKLTVSGVGSATGSSGTQAAWDFGSIFIDLGGTISGQGYIAALYVYDRKLKESEIQSMQTYLSTKFNL